MDDKIIKGVDKYYTDKINLHGTNAAGVDWNSKESQYIRFKQLCNVINAGNNFSILDFGCGYAELINYLSNEFDVNSFRYSGFDISAKMIDQARNLFSHLQNAEFFVHTPEKKCNYVVASGIFNVKVEDVSNAEWLQYIQETITTLNDLSENGFAFNALTSYSDVEFKKDYLYYADPLQIFDYCKKHFSRNVALLHDYNLYEFTILVRK